MGNGQGENPGLAGLRVRTPDKRKAWPLLLAPEKRKGADGTDSLSPVARGSRRSGVARAAQTILPDHHRVVPGLLPTWPRGADGAVGPGFHRLGSPTEATCRLAVGTVERSVALVFP